MSVLYCCIHLPSQNEFKIIFGIQARLGLRPMHPRREVWRIAGALGIHGKRLSLHPSHCPKTTFRSTSVRRRVGTDRAGACDTIKDPFTKQIKPITGQMKYFRHQLSIFVQAEDQTHDIRFTVQSGLKA